MKNQFNQQLSVFESITVMLAFILVISAMGISFYTEILGSCNQ